MNKKIVVLVLATLVLVSVQLAEAQQAKKVPRIGILFPTTPAAAANLLEAFKQGLRELGYAEGQNVLLELRYAGTKSDQLPVLAAELVRLKADLIVAGSTPGILAAKNATSAIPIVMTTTGDPVASGLVASLARPGGNVTGVTAIAQELSGKRLELLKETVPGVTRVAVLLNPDFQDSKPSVKGAEETARALKVQLRLLEVRDPSELEKAFAAMSSEHAGALLALPAPMFNSERERIVTLSAKRRLPAMYGLREFVDVGGLMFYGASLSEMYRRAATYVDKILKGAKPADLPVEQPTKFELIINLKAAKQISLTIPPNVLYRADKVIK